MLARDQSMLTNLRGSVIWFGYTGQRCISLELVDGLSDLGRGRGGTVVRSSSSSSSTTTRVAGHSGDFGRETGFHSDDADGDKNNNKN